MSRVKKRTFVNKDLERIWDIIYYFRKHPGIADYTTATLYWSEENGYVVGPYLSPGIHSGRDRMTVVAFLYGAEHEKVARWLRRNRNRLASMANLLRLGGPNLPLLPLLDAPGRIPESADDSLKQIRKGVKDV